MIRRVAPKDLEQVVALCHRLHQRSRYRRIQPHWPTIMSTIVRMSGSKTGIVLVAEHDGKLTGMLVGLAQEYWWTESLKGARFASDLLFYSERRGDGKQMMRQFVEWAWKVPRVVRVEVGVSAGIRAERVDRFFREQVGLDYAGPMYGADHPRMEVPT